MMSNSNYIQGIVQQINDARTYYKGTASKPKWSVIVLCQEQKIVGDGIFNHVKLICYDPQIVDSIKVGLGYVFEVSIEGTRYIPKNSITNNKDVFNEVIILTANRYE